MTWSEREDGYEVLFNRDERRTRKPAAPPSIRQAGSLRYLAPADGDFGGAWIAVNELGLTLAIENGYLDQDDLSREPAGGFTSRGLLVTSLAGETTVGAVLRRLEREDLARYRSFLLAVFAADGRRALARFTHGALDLDREIDRLMPIVSSSFETAEVARSRRALFERMAASTEFADRSRLLLAFHRSHLPERGPRSPCMHRPEAETVSFSRVEVDRHEVRFHYVGQSPCRGLPAHPPRMLPRRDAG